MQPDKSSGTIKEQLSAIAPALEQLWQQKEERVRAFSDVQSQIQKICEEIAGGLNNGPHVVDESDLSLKRLDDFQSKLQELQKEKVNYLLGYGDLWRMFTSRPELKLLCVWAE